MPLINRTPMDNYKNHLWSPFEGYYTRVDLPSGSSLIFIICTVPAAERRAHNVTLTYISSSGHIWQQEEFPDKMKFEQLINGDGFRLVGFQPNSTLSLNAAPDQTTVIDKRGEIDMELTTRNHTHWSKTILTPESWLNYLPLPLHWHVYSLQSEAQIKLSLPKEAQMDPADADSVGVGHLEKNWAISFPSAHIWLQARQPGRGICLAGGKTMGQIAFLMGYRNDAKGIELDFRPPFAMKFFGVYGPFMETKIDFENRTFEVDVSNLTQRMVVKASGPKGTFYSLSGPYQDGHKHNWMAQTLRGHVSLEIYKRKGLFGWELVLTDEFNKAGQEFGGDFYPDRGTDIIRH